MKIWFNGFLAHFSKIFSQTKRNRITLNRILEIRHKTQNEKEKKIKLLKNQNLSIKTVFTLDTILWLVLLLLDE